MLNNENMINWIEYTDGKMLRFEKFIAVVRVFPPSEENGFLGYRWFVRSNLLVRPVLAEGYTMSFEDGQEICEFILSKVG